MTLTLTFVPDAEKPETKNTFKFQEQTENGMPPKVGTLYVQKHALSGVEGWALNSRLPKTLKVTIEVQ